MAAQAALLDRRIDGALVAVKAGRVTLDLTALLAIEAIGQTVVETGQKMTGTGPAAPPIPVYDLAAPTLLPTHAFGGSEVTIAEPTAVVALQTQRLLSRTDEGQLIPIGTMQWSDSLPKLLQAKLIESFDTAGLTATDTAPAASSCERQLHLDLRRFDITAGSSPKAEVNFGAKLLSADGRVLQARIFSAQVPAATDERSAIQALNTTFAETARDLATWLDGRS